MAETKAAFTLATRMNYQLVGVDPRRALAAVGEVTDRLVRAHKANGVRVTSIALTPAAQTCTSPLSPLLKLDEAAALRAGCVQFEVAMRIKTSDRLALETAWVLNGLDVCDDWEEMCWEAMPVGQCEYDPVPLAVFPLVCGGVLLAVLVTMLVVLRKKARLFCTARKQRRTDRSDAVVALVDSMDLKMEKTVSNGYKTTCKSKVGDIFIAPVVHYGV